jgi:hypothetical protein
MQHTSKPPVSAKADRLSWFPDGAWYVRDFTCLVPSAAFSRVQIATTSDTCPGRAL